MRTFTFSDAKSHKFWNIDLQGNQFTVTYGKIGTAGQTQTKTFADDAKAQKEYEKLIKEKLSKGYVETSAKVKSSKEVMEEAIIQNPNDRTAFAAYADLLIEEGNPQGEFIQVQLALEDESLDTKERKKLQKREKELLQAHERTWLGALASFYLDREGVDDWRKADFEKYFRYKFVRGVLGELFCDSLGVNFARKLLASTTETRFVHTLEIGSTAYEVPGDEYEAGDDIPEEAQEDYPSMYLLAKWKNLSHLHRFLLGEIGEEDYANCHAEGETAHHLVKQMPLIEELRLHAHRVDIGKLSVLPMPQLRILDLAHTHQYPLKKLAENKSLTNLKQLLIYPHAVEEELPYALSDLKAVCRSPNLPNLTHLRMRISLMGDDAIEEIIDSGLIKRLKYLDLFSGTISDEGAEMLANCPDAKNLDTLNLTCNELTEEGIKKLEALKIRHFEAKNQHGSTADIDRENIWEMEFLFYGDIE